MTWRTPDTHSTRKLFASRRPHLPGRVSYASKRSRRKSSALEQPWARAGVGAYASITDAVGLWASHAISLGVEQKVHFPLWPRSENQRMQANDKSGGAAGICEGSVYPISVSHSAGPLWPGIMKNLSAGEAADTAATVVGRGFGSWKAGAGGTPAVCLLPNPLSEPQFPLLGGGGEWESHSSYGCLF